MALLRTFTLSRDVVDVDALHVYLNGALLQRGTDWTLTAPDKVNILAPAGLLLTDRLEARYATEEPGGVGALAYTLLTDPVSPAGVPAGCTTSPAPPRIGAPDLNVHFYDGVTVSDRPPLGSTLAETVGWLYASPNPGGITYSQIGLAAWYMKPDGCPGLYASSVSGTSNQLPGQTTSFSQSASLAPFPAGSYLCRVVISGSRSGVNGANPYILRDYGSF